MASDLLRVLRTAPRCDDMTTTDVTFAHPDVAHPLPIESEEINSKISEACRNHIRIAVSRESDIT